MNIQDQDKQTEAVAIISNILRKNVIDTYTVQCGCGFTFVPMTHWVKEGEKYCECGACGEVNLLG